MPTPAELIKRGPPGGGAEDAQEGVYTEGQMSAWFKAAGIPAEVKNSQGKVVETQAQRLARLTQQLNAGSRTSAQVWAEIVNGPNLHGAVEQGGMGAGKLQEIYGANPEVWFDTQKGIYYLGYNVPGTTVPLLYTMSHEQMVAIFGPERANWKPDRKLTTAGIAKVGGIYAGQATDPKGNPYLTFIDQLEKEAEIRPWLRDPDMLAKTFEAALEGRDVSQAEMMNTKWWRTHNEAQRAWLILSNADPKTAAQRMTDSIAQTKASLEQYGMANPPASLVRLLATKKQTGDWSEIYWTNQMRAVSDPYSGIRVDASLKTIIDDQNLTLNTARTHEEKVRAEVVRWLGPLHGNWNDAQIKRWAGKMRNDPDATEELTTMLRSQRMSLFPEYSNENLTYEDIAGPWKQMVESAWGQPADEMEPFFTQLIHKNDYHEAGKTLVREGLKRKIGAVTQGLETASNNVGAQARPMTMGGG